MKSILIGQSRLSSSRLAYGCWRIGGRGVAEAVTEGRKAVLAAYEAGYRLFDHADIYSDGMGERIFGDVLKEVSGMRGEVVIASKCGIRKPGDPFPAAPYRYDFRHEHIVAACEGSLKRLGVSTIDIYQLHRPDYLADPVEVARAFDDLARAGKVRELGLSNCRPSLVAVLQKACPRPLIVHQVEISLLNHSSFTDGTLDQCLQEKMTPMAWSPLGGGRLFDGGPQSSARVGPVIETLGRLAGLYQATPAAIALAWLMKHPSMIIPIVGSTKPARIQEATQAAEIILTHEEWYALLEAARGERLP